MTQPPAIPPPPILDLRGPDRPALHMPGRIAAACWLLAAYSLIPVSALAILLFIRLAGIDPSPLFFDSIAVGTTGTGGLLIIAAMIFFASADLSAGRLKRWPRWWMATAGILAGILLDTQAISWLCDVYMLKHLNLEAFNWCSAITEAMTASSFVFGAIFAAQAAAWWRRRRLLIASILILGLCAAYHGLESLMVVQVIARSHGLVPRLAENFDIAVGRIFTCLELLLILGSTPYFILIAVHLTRARRQNLRGISKA